MNKKLLLIGAISALSFNPIFAQKGKVNTAEFNLTNGDIVKAKENIDDSFSDSSMNSWSKAWLVKGDVYRTIFEQKDAHKDLYSATPNTLSIAKESYIKAFNTEEKPKKKAAIKEPLHSVGIYFYNEGIGAFQANNWKSAYTDFKNALDISNFLYDNKLTNVIDTQAYNVVMLSAFNTQNFDEAEKAGEKLLSLGDNREVVYTVLIDTYKQKGENEKYEKTIDAARKAYPDNLDILYREINLYLANNRLEELEDKLKQAIKLAPNNPSLYQALANVYDKKGNREEALSLYDKAIEIDPQYKDAYINKASLYNNDANKIIEQMNNTSDNNKYDQLKAQRDDIFKNKMLPLLLKAYKIDSKNQNVIKALKEIYARLNMMDELQKLGK